MPSLFHPPFPAAAAERAPPLVKNKAGGGRTTVYIPSFIFQRAGQRVDQRGRAESPIAPHSPGQSAAAPWVLYRVLGCTPGGADIRALQGQNSQAGSLRKDPSCDFKSLTGMVAKDGTAIPPAAAMDNHHTFTEHVQRPVKRYPHVYQGFAITMTQKDDGSLQPHLKPAPRNMSESSYKKYAWLVRDELMEAYKIAEANKKAADEKKKGFEEDEPQPFGY